MSTVVVARENFSRSLSAKLLKPEESRDAVDAACIARAIAQRMDPEWREFVAGLVSDFLCNDIGAAHARSASSSAIVCACAVLRNYSRRIEFRLISPSTIRRGSAPAG